MIFVIQSSDDLVNEFYVEVLNIQGEIGRISATKHDLLSSGGDRTSTGIGDKTEGSSAQTREESARVLKKEVDQVEELKKQGHHL